MRKQYTASFLAAALLLTAAGCASVLERSYSSVQPHTSQYWEDMTASALRAEDYQSLVNGLLMLVSNHTDAGIVRLYGYENQEAAVRDMEKACAEVTMEDPLGAYLVDYLTYDCAEKVNCYEMTVKMTYQRTPAQKKELMNATTVSALPELLRQALEKDRQDLAVKVGYVDRDKAEMEAMIAEWMEAELLEETLWSVQYYPENPVQEGSCIIEVTWQAASGLDMPHAEG